eukprot:6181805-Pleurochrysis_carterae.AAC.3
MAAAARMEGARRVRASTKLKPRACEDCEIDSCECVRAWLLSGGWRKLMRIGSQSGLGSDIETMRKGTRLQLSVGPAKIAR